MKRGALVAAWLVADPWRRAALAAASAGLLATSAAAAQPTPDVMTAWDRYVRLTEERIEGELARQPEALLIDLHDGPRAGSERRDVLEGAVVTADMQTTDAQGREIDVPSAMLHHWRGAVFVPGVALDALLDELQHPGRPGARAHDQEDVLESRVIDRDGDALRLFLKLQRRTIVTVTYNTEHEVRYRRLGPTMAASRSVSTKIAELEDGDTAAEREKPPGEDRGFLWRLNSYWRYQEVPGGVVVECESLTLSRDIPAAIRFVARPIVARVARESMTRTLESLRARFAARSPARQSARFTP